jgi:hypothetical protein
MKRPTFWAVLVRLTESDPERYIFYGGLDELWAVVPKEIYSASKSTGEHPASGLVFHLAAARPAPASDNNHSSTGVLPS